MRPVRIVVIGAGMSGVCAAVKLTKAGFTDVTILEKGDDIGGTWRENTYPGLSCDVASRAYCYSFAPNAEWTAMFPPGPEVKAYFRQVAERFGILEKVRFGTEVTEGVWRDGAWQIRTSRGDELTADLLVSACGILHHPSVPPLEGLETFAGPKFHTARWDHSVQTAGKRVGMIGTGSTGTQVASALGGVASRFTVFQRSAQWMFPLSNHRFTRFTRWLYRRSPKLSELSYKAWQWQYNFLFVGATIKPGPVRVYVQGLCRLHLLTIRDKELRANLTPDHQPMCRRLIMGTRYYKTLKRDDVELVTEDIERIEPTGVRTKDGRLHELDVLVLATGFDTQAYLRPIELTGPAGNTLSEAWAHTPKAYRTVALPGFPNFAMLMGPHSPVGNVSLVAIAETQADYIVGWADLLRRGAVEAAAPRADVTDRFNDEMKRDLPNTVWTTGCKSWYLDADGLPALWPWTPQRHREMLAAPALDEFEPVA